MPIPHRVKIAEQIVHRLAWDDVDLGAVRRLLELARDEAVRAAPRSAAANGAGLRTVEFVAGGRLVFCGAALLPMIAGAFGARGVSVRARAADGAAVEAGATVGMLTGPAADLRTVAPVALAFLARLSGLATHVRLHADALGGGRTRLLDDADTTPGWSGLERYALACGGAWSGGTRSSRIEADADDPARLEAAVRAAREGNPGAPVRLVVREMAAIDAAVAAAPDVIRLERFDTGAIREAVARVCGRAFVEAHGGVTLEKIGAHAGLGLDFVAVDGLVDGAARVAIGAEWRD